MINNSDDLSAHGSSTNTSQCILKKNLEGLELSEDSSLGKTVLDMVYKCVHFLEELYICKGEVKELEELIQQCNLNMSSKKQASIMYKDHVEYLREAGY